MSAWRTAKAIKTLQAEVNAAHPKRPKQADGTIGDVRHQNESQSDHNPNSAGVVTAWDITTADFTIALAESLRRLGKQGDLRVKYVIYRGQIASSKDDWAWRAYSGFSKHYDHIHLSVSADPKQYDRTDPWFPVPDKQQAQAAVKPTPIPAPPSPEDDVTPEDIEKIAQRVKQLVAQDIAVILHGTRDGNHPANLDNIYAAVKK